MVARAAAASFNAAMSENAELRTLLEPYLAELAALPLTPSERVTMAAAIRGAALRKLQEHLIDGYASWLIDQVDSGEDVADELPHVVEAPPL